MSMKLKVKGDDTANPNEKDPGPVSFPWEGGMQAIAAGAAEAYAPPKDADRGPDMPGAQSPAPGVDPVGGKEVAADGQVLTNMTSVGAPNQTSGGLQKMPEPPPSKTVEATKVTEAPKPVQPVKVVDGK